MSGQERKLGNRVVAHLRKLLDETWFQLLVGGAWMLALGFLGIFEIEPMTLRLACWPVLGIVNTAFFIRDTEVESRRLTVGEYLATSLLAAPLVALLVGLALGFLMYALIEGIRWVISL